MRILERHGWSLTTILHDVYSEPMSPTLFAALILFGFLLALGQVLFKMAGRDTVLVRSWSDLAALFATPWMWAALVVYGIATVLWVVLLQRVPLSRAYPFAALGFVLVPAAASWLFAEHLGPLYLVGAALVVAGIITIGLAN